MSSQLLKSAVSSIPGTIGMTVFSILTSQKKNEQFREHEILSALLKIFHLNEKNRNILAWTGHYGMGMTFNVVNQQILKKLKISPTLLNGVLLGAANGAVGIMIWKLIFKLHPSPPKISLNKYLAHLMLAHLVFGALSNLSMKKTPATSESTHI